MAAPKLKATQVKELRERLVEEQGNVCPLCEHELTNEDAVLDHDHGSGHCRQALHRSCNSAEGRILHWAGVRSKGDDPVLFITNILSYWEKDYGSNPIHHTHGRKKKRRRRPRMKRKANVK